MTELLPTASDLCEFEESDQKVHQPTELNTDDSFLPYCIKREPEDSTVGLMKEEIHIEKFEEHKPGCELIDGTSICSDELDQYYNNSIHKNELESPELESKSEGETKHNRALYKCEECSYETINKGNLTQHYKYKHSKDVEVYKCRACSYETRYKSALIRHFKCVHAKEDKIYKCQECSYETRYNSDLTKHCKCVHAKEGKMYKCQECSFETKLQRNLTNHYTYKHTREAKMYKCQECAYETRYKSSLNRHLKCIHAKGLD